MPQTLHVNKSEVEGSQSPLLSVIVPVYCEQESIGELYRRLKGVLDGLAPALRHEVLFVDEGSTDDSHELLAQVAAGDDHVRVIRFSRNFGHQVAISAGLDYAEGDAVVIIDADLQDPPEVILDFVDRWREGYEVVYGQRRARKGESAFKRATASVFYRGLQWLSDTELPLDSGDFRLLDRRVVAALCELRESGRYMRGMVSWVGFRQCPVPYDRDARYAGTTKYPLTKMIRFGMDGVASFSGKPLVMCAQLGFLVMVLALALALWALISHLVDPAATTQGWTSVVLVVLFLGGVQLISVGVLGAYVARIYMETKRRPLYIVSDVMEVKRVGERTGS